MAEFVAPITKSATPRDMMRPMIFFRGAIVRHESSSGVLPLRRKKKHHAALSTCERTVAAAAPRTPMRNTKMNSGSSTMFATAPSSTVSMPRVAKPCALIYTFMPSDTNENVVPMRYTARYSRA